MPGQQQENAFNSLSGFYKESLCSSVLGSTGIADATQAAVYENAQKKGETLQNSFTLYPSGMVVARLDPVENRLTYTKHYYSGTQRLSSKIGTTTNLGEFLSEWTLTSNTNELPVNPVALSQQQLRVAELGLNNVLSKLQINTTTEAGAEASPSIPSFLHAGNEPNAYYFHADHLGSTSAITDANGSLTQHVLYFAYGEQFVDERRNSTNSPYLFNGKELDTETGRYYYGARYYDPRVSLWIGVDPLAEERSWMSPYNYCSNNPILRIDPDGALDDDYFNKMGKYLGSDEAKTDNVKIIDQKDWDANKTLNPDGSESITHVKGSAISTNHSESNLTEEATLNVYDHYNSTDLDLKAKQDETGMGGLTFRASRKSGKTSEWIDVKIEGNKKTKVADHANEIINMFIHEKLHYSDYKTIGFEGLLKMDVNRREQRAITEQMKDESFKGTRPFFQKAVIDYGRKHGMISPIKPKPAVLISLSQ
jgi:RHS repeat-associated protein